MLKSSDDNISMKNYTKCIKNLSLKESMVSHFFFFFFFFLGGGGEGAQWLSGRVLDSRPKGSGFEPHRRHCVVVLEQDTFILA